MTAFTRRTAILLLAVLVLLSIAVRYPLVEHERNQTDSYFIHLLSQSISTDGYAKWAVHPLSYLGYYPFSYPSGVPFIVAELSAMTGLSVEVTILLLGTMIGVLFCLGMFLLARQFLRRPEHALLAVFFSILGARFVDTSYWDGSARAPMVALVVLVVFVLFRAASTRQRLLLAVALFLGVGCFATHHMAVLLILFGGGYVLAAVQIKFLLARASIHKRRVAIVSTVAMGISIGILVIGLSGFSGNLGFERYQKTSVFDLDPPLLSIVLNLALSYTNQIGVVIILAAFGIPSLFKKPRLSVETLYPLTLLLAFLPMLADSLYVSMLVSPFVAILGAGWIARLYRTGRGHKVVVVAITIFMASSVLLPIWSSNRWNSREYLSGDTVEVGNTIFNDGIYLSASGYHGYATSNNNVLTAELGAIGSMNFLGSNILLLINGDVTSRDVHKNATWSSAEFPKNLYLWLEYPNAPDVDIYVLVLMTNGIGILPSASNLSGMKIYFSTHSNLLVVVDNKISSRFVNMYSDLPAKLPSELQRATWFTDVARPDLSHDLPSYITYASERVSIYAVELPI